MTPEERAANVLRKHLATPSMPSCTHDVNTMWGLHSHTSGPPVVTGTVNSDLIALIASAIRDAERAAAERAWNTVNALIKSGNLEDPYHSERNGLISAANAIRQSQEPKA